MSEGGWATGGKGADKGEGLAVRNAQEKEAAVTKKKEEEEEAVENEHEKNNQYTIHASARSHTTHTKHTNTHTHKSARAHTHMVGPIPMNDQRYTLG